jgi:hypothetical protein
VGRALNGSADDDKKRTNEHAYSPAVCVQGGPNER